MITKERIVEVQVLHKQGHSIRELARMTGLSRNTVRRYLREPQAADGYKRRQGIVTLRHSEAF